MKNFVKNSFVRFTLLGCALALSIMVALISVKDSTFLLTLLSHQGQDSFLAASRGAYSTHHRTTKTTTSVSVVTTSPTAPVAPVVTSPTPSPSSNRYGVSVSAGLGTLSDQEIKQELDDLVAMGVGWVRYDFGWDQIQAGGSTSYDWVAPDRVVKAVLAHNLKILPLLTYTPAWARPSGCINAFCGPANVADFANFAKVVVARYAPQGVHTWEIWNEPNVMQFWQPKPDPVAYTALLKAAYTAIKTQDQSAVVVSGGLAPAVTTSDKSLSPTDFVTGMYAQGAQSNFDALGFHPYSYPAMPSNTSSWNAWAQMSVTAINIRGIMTANNDAGKQIWMTEFGSPTGGPGAIATQSEPNFINMPDHVDEALQAALLGDAGSLLRQYSWAGPLFLYSYKDLGVSPVTNENFFGLLRYDGSQKPVYSVLKQLTAAQ